MYALFKRMIPRGGCCHRPRLAPRSAYTLALWLAGLSLLSAPLLVHAEIYIHRDKDGTRWFTDRRDMGAGYTFIGTHGRPTATASCQGVNSRVMSDRAAPYQEIIRHYAAHYRVDPNLVHAVIMVESCFDRLAVSRVGAQGLMQLMPGTAREVGVDDAFNARQNIRGGITYLARMLERFNHDTRLALAAYNAGPGAVQRHGGIPPYTETQNYVKRVLGHYNSMALISH